MISTHLDATDSSVTGLAKEVARGGFGKITTVTEESVRKAALSTVEAMRMPALGATEAIQKAEATTMKAAGRYDEATG